MFIRQPHLLSQLIWKGDITPSIIPLGKQFPEPEYCAYIQDTFKAFRMYKLYSSLVPFISLYNEDNCEECLRGF